MTKTDIKTVILSIVLSRNSSSNVTHTKTATTPCSHVLQTAVMVKSVKMSCQHMFYNILCIFYYKWATNVIHKVFKWFSYNQIRKIQAETHQNKCLDHASYASQVNSYDSMSCFFHKTTRFLHRVTQFRTWSRYNWDTQSYLVFLRRFNTCGIQSAHRLFTYLDQATNFMTLQYQDFNVFENIFFESFINKRCKKCYPYNCSKSSLYMLKPSFIPSESVSNCAEI